MPSTYTLNNGIELIATGEQSGTWGDTTNTNLSLVDTALDGQVTVTLTAAGTSGSPNTLAISDGAASDGRNRMVIFNDGADLGATAYVQLTPNDAEKIIYVRNDLSGSRSILLFQGTYSASNDYEVPAGTTAVVYFNGAGSGAVAANVFNNAYFDSLRLGDVSVTAILDEDDMSSDSATSLATQQSIKAYVDTQVGANNELSEVLANGNTTGGTDISVSSGDDITFADSSRALFGADSDLRIYHNALNSIIEDTGTGGLLLRSNQLNVQNAAGTETLAQFNEDSSVVLRYDNEVRFATTANGANFTGDTVSITGTAAGARLQISTTDSGAADGPIFALYRDSSSPAASDNIARIDFLGENANSDQIAYGRIDTFIQSPTAGAEEGRMRLLLESGGAQRSFLELDASAGGADGRVWINSPQADIDFRVSGDNEANLFYVDASTDRIGVGVGTPSTAFHIKNATMELRLEDTGTGDAANPYISMYGAGGRNGYFGFAGGSDSDWYFHNEMDGGDIALYVGTSTQGLRVNGDSSGVIINEGGADRDFRVESNADAHAIFLDAENSRVGINSSSPASGYDLTLGSLGINVNQDSAVSHLTGTRGYSINTGGNNTSFRVATLDGIGSRVRIRVAGSIGYGNPNFQEYIIEAGQGNVADEFGVNVYVIGDTNQMQPFAITNSEVLAYTDRIDGDTYDLWLYLGHFARVDIFAEEIAGTTLRFDNYSGTGASIPVTAVTTNNTSQLGLGARSVQIQAMSSNETSKREVFSADYDEVVVNEASNDVDFRIESNNETHCFFLNADTGYIGINESGPTARLHVRESAVLGSTAGDYKRLFRLQQETGNEQYLDGIAIRTSNGSDWTTQGIRLQSVVDSTEQAYVEWNGANTQHGMVLGTGSDNTGYTGSGIQPRVTLKASGEIVFNDPANDYNFRVESENITNMLFVDAENDEFGVGQTPSGNQGRLQIKPKANGVLYYRPAGYTALRTESSGSGTDDWIYMSGTYTDTSHSVGLAMHDYNGNFNQYAGSFIRTKNGKVRIGHFNGGANTGENAVVLDNFTFDSAGGAVFNERGAGGDFRVETANDEKIIFVDNNLDQVGIGMVDANLTGGPRLSVNGDGGAASGSSGTTRAAASMRIMSSGTGALGTGTSIFMGIEDSSSVWIQGQHITDDSEKVLKLNPAGGNVLIPHDQLRDEDGVKFFYTYLNNYGGSLNLSHINGSLGNTPDPGSGYVILCPAYDGTNLNKSFVYGRMYRTRGNSVAGNITNVTEFMAASAYNSNQGGGYYMGVTTTNLVKCTYDSTAYLALQLSQTSASTINVDMWYSGSTAPFYVSSGVTNVTTVKTFTNI